MMMRRRSRPSDCRGRRSGLPPSIRPTRPVGALLGTRPETVARTIRGLDSDGVARFAGSHVTIHELDALLPLI